MTPGGAGHNAPVAAVLSFSGACDERSAREVRRLLRAAQAAGELPMRLVEDLELAATELITNAVRAGARLVHVELDQQPLCCWLRVADDAPGLPIRGDAAAHATTGRGLQIIAGLSTEWGVDGTRTGNGKAVWARFDLR